MRMSSIGPSREPIIVQSEVEPATLHQDASFWQQLKATIVRNLLRKKRNKKQVVRVSYKVLFSISYCKKSVVTVLEPGNRFTMREVITQKR